MNNNDTNTDDVLYGFSRASGRYYRVNEWIELDDGTVCPTDGAEIPQSEFPDKLFETDEWIRFRDAPRSPFTPSEDPKYEVDV